MKRISFVVTIDFADDVDDDDKTVREIANNVFDGLIGQINGAGLAPEDTFTESVCISKDGLTLIEETI
jgi:hypothetical protein